jgi:hypothetical protein
MMMVLNIVTTSMQLQVISPVESIYQLLYIKKVFLFLLMMSQIFIYISYKFLKN